ncbi:MAG: helicase-related protein, partial [Rubritalea sp.]|uniref:helicase-related protein n=1 Tax=Rubritalea sp. TaxID=2109375 RepID=UPI0032424096
MDLPVYEVEQELLGALSNVTSARALLKAPTGSGKSTAVPQILLDSGLVEGLIVVVQPRRIAARMLARRVSSLRNGRVGGEVGHVVRFDRQMGRGTRIVYVTDGVLATWLESGSMEEVGAVIFDEFHERRLASDLSLALCLEWQEQKNQSLKLVVMSATLELAGLADYLGGQCTQIEASGRSYPVEVSYKGAQIQSRGGGRRESMLWDKCASAVKELVESDSVGHILVFLPGVYEIRRTVELIERSAWSRSLQVCPLYSALSPEKQDSAVLGNGDRRRIIVSTNVAETSLTIDGVRSVVDSGLARISEYDPVRGLDTLMVQKISRAAAAQRAGRAGRTGPGHCVRLWSETDHGRRDAFETPEVQRTDLSETVLQLKGRGVLDARDFRWLECPKLELLEHAVTLLSELSAVDADGGLSTIGEQMAKMRMHPRYARLLISAQSGGCLAEAVFIAACVQGEGVFARNGDGKKAFLYEDDLSDFAGEWRAFQSAQHMQFDLRRCQNIGVLAKGAREVVQAMKQIQQQCKRVGWDLAEVDFEKNAQAVSRAMLTAFSDQVGVRIGKGNLACRLVGRRKGKLDESSVVRNAGAFIVTELTEVGGKDVQLYLNRCVSISLDDLRQIFPSDFVDGAHAYFDETIRRVVNRSEQRFRDLVLTSKDGGEPDLGVAAQLLAERVA